MNTFLTLFPLLISLVHSQDRVSTCTADGKVEFVYQEVRSSFANAIAGCAAAFGPSSTLASLSDSARTNLVNEFFDNIQVNEDIWIGLIRPRDAVLTAQGVENLRDPKLFTFLDGTPIQDGFASIRGVEPWQGSKPNNGLSGNQACVL